MIDLIKKATDDNIGRKMALDEIVKKIKQDPDLKLSFTALEYAQALQMIISHSEELVKTISGYHFGLLNALELISDGQLNSAIDLLKSVKERPIDHYVELSDGTPCCEGCDKSMGCEEC